jgi:hypothetical protein
MKTMILGAFAFAFVLALATTPGHALSFDFSFTNVTGTVNGTVSGLIEGLTDNTTSVGTVSVEKPQVIMPPFFRSAH